MGCDEAKFKHRCQGDLRHWFGGVGESGEVSVNGQEIGEGTHRVRGHHRGPVCKMSEFFETALFLVCEIQ